MRLTLIGMIALSALLTGCAKDDLLRTEGLTMTAGDSIARNKALQVIDPWPAGVEDTNLRVPAVRSDNSTTAVAASAAPSTVSP